MIYPLSHTKASTLNHMGILLRSLLTYGAELPSGGTTTAYNGLLVTMVTCGPGPRKGRPRGTKCRLQSDYKLQERAADGRGQQVGPVPVDGPGPLPQSLQRCTGGSPLLPLRGPQTPPLGVPQRLGLRKDGVFREMESRRYRTETHQRGQSRRNAQRRIQPGRIKGER